LIYDEQDKQDIKALDDYFYDELGMEVVKTVFKGGPDELREMHRKRLEICDVVIIYYHHANEFWLNAKLDDLRKAAALRRSNPLLATAVYVTGEETEHKEEFRTREALVIKNFEAFSPEAMAKFVAGLQKAS
jgi:hypothetical protein